MSTSSRHPTPERGRVDRAPAVGEASGFEPFARRKTSGGGEIRAGVLDGLTMIVAYIPFALALGAALVSSGVNPVTAWASSTLIFAGAAQLVSIQLIGSGAGVAVIVATGLVMNSRHLLYGASLAPYTPAWSRQTRAFAAYFLADPVYALAIARFEARDEPSASRLRYYLSVGLTCWLGWIVLTAAGGLLAGALPTALPLELAAPLTFLLLLLPTLKDHPSYIAAGVAGAVAVPAASLPLGLGLLAAAIAGILAGATTGRRRRA